MAKDDRRLAASATTASAARLTPETSGTLTPASTHLSPSLCVPSTHCHVAHEPGTRATSVALSGSLQHAASPLAEQLDT